MRLGRRAVVGGLGALSLSRCARPADPGVFPLGVASGDVDSTSARVWTKTRAPSVALEVWPEGGAPLASTQVAASARGVASAVVTGLEPGRWYGYRFDAAEASSQEGRFRTALAADALEPLRLGATSCIRAGVPYDVLGDAAARAFDAFVFLGDAVYTDGARTQADFDEKWATGLRGSEYQALRASTSMVALWDDHEVRNNWEGGSIDPAFLALARAAWVDHQPVRLADELSGPTYRSLRWGRTAELFALDSRGERSRQRDEYLSPRQLDWLVKGVAASPAVFKLVLNTVPIGAFDFPFYAPFNDDHWVSYPEQRRAVLEALDDVPGVIVVSGDFHFGCFGLAAASGPGAKVTEVLVGPGANQPNPAPSYPSAEPWAFSTARRNYVSFALDPLGRRATVQFVGPGGAVLFERDVPA